MRFLTPFLGLLLVATLGRANPVIYQGGQMIDTAVDSTATDIQWMYSATSSTAFGYRYTQFAAQNQPLHMAQFNWLANRWNEPDSQANIYAMAGIGMQGQSVTPYLGAEVDWESRHYYVAATAEHLWMPQPTTKLVARVGVAPYVGEYTDLHTWLILQATSVQSNGQSSQWVLPIVRLFKDTILAEFGSNGSTHYASLRLHF